VCARIFPSSAQNFSLPAIVVSVSVKMVRTGFAGNCDAAFLRLADQRHAARRAQVLTMDFRPGEFCEQNVPRDDHLLARRRPASQTKRKT